MREEERDRSLLAEARRRGGGGRGGGGGYTRAKIAFQMVELLEENLIQTAWILNHLRILQNGVIACHIGNLREPSARLICCWLDMADDVSISA